MKKIFMAALLLAGSTLHAQMKEGRIVYSRTFQMPQMPNMDPEMAARIPKSRTDNYELLFGNNQSLWQFIPAAEGESDGNSFGGGGMFFRMAGANDVSYHNLETGMRTDHRDIVDREYIVTDSIRKLNWKLTEETRTVLNYTVRKATSQRIMPRMRMSMENGEMKRETVQDTATVVAWFTTDIPVAVGPEYQGQLPGAILELNIDNGQTIYTATEISPKVSLSKIKEPKGGKKMTAAEFSKEREKLMEEMRKNMPEGMQFRRAGN